MANKYRTAFDAEVARLRGDGVVVKVAKSEFKGPWKLFLGLYDVHKHAVYINPVYPYAVRLTVLFHEFSHYTCAERGCRCDVNDIEWLQEYHAFKHCLTECVEKKLTASVKFTMVNLAGMARDNADIYPEHVKAIRKLMRTKVWGQGLALLSPSARAQVENPS